MADNFKAWVASVVTREGGISVTEKHSMVGGGGGGGGAEPSIQGPVSQDD